MANYNATTRTNYFSVINLERLAELVGQMSSGEDAVQLFDDGKGKYGFGCYGNISGLSSDEGTDDDCKEPDYDLMCEELQGILADGDAIIIMEAGYEKMRCVFGTGTIITKNSIEVVSLRDCLLNKARNMLGDSAFCTQMEY